MGLLALAVSLWPVGQRQHIHVLLNYYRQLIAQIRIAFKDRMRPGRSHTSLQGCINSVSEKAIVSKALHFSTL